MYALQGKEIRKVEIGDAAIWENRRIGLDKVGPFTISTVFLPANHGTQDKPKFFETLIFVDENVSPDLHGYLVDRLRDEGDTITDRYATYDEAEAGHAQRLEQLRAELPGLDVSQPDL